jgi:RND family efflux transporter MFP subunit
LCTNNYTWKDETVASRKVKMLLPPLVVMISIAIAGVMIANKPSQVLAPAVDRSPLVDVAEVHLQDLRIPVLAQGTVMPHRDTTVVSEVSGKIIEASTNFNAGGYVAAGDVLVRIDDRDYQANLLRATASVKTAESNLAQEKGRVEVARREWKRMPKTSNRSAAGKALYLRKPQLEQATAQLLSAQADLRKTEDDLERTIIRAPYDALIQEKRSDLGQYVTPGTPVARVFSVDFAEVRLALPQSRLSYLDLPGVRGYAPEDAPTVDLYTDVAGLVTHWTARLHRTEAALDERSRVLFTVARLEDPYAMRGGEAELLRVGTFVKASILGREMNNMVLLPRHVLRAGNQLWVVDAQLKLRNREVHTLRTEGDEIYVTSGLQEGDLVALSTINDALPGMKVRINSRVSTLGQTLPVMEAAATTPKKPADNSQHATSAST